MPRNDYPATVAEVLDDSATYHPDALRALKRFRRSRPWRGTRDERCSKLAQLNLDLAIAYNMTPPTLRICTAPVEGGDCYCPRTHTIRLIATGDHVSVVTFLHEFAHARGWASERKVCRWSINLFRRIFPRSFARCRQVGHLLMRGS